MYKGIDKILLISSLILFAIGLVMVFSASSVTAYNSGLSANYYFLRQALFLGIGLFIGAALIMNSRLKFIGWISFLLMMIVFGGLVYLIFWGNSYYGAKSWISLGHGATLQPSEFAKIVSIVWIPFMIYDQKKFKGWSKYLIVCLFVIFTGFFIAIEPDWGTAIIYGLICLIIFFTINEDPEKKKKLKFYGLICLVIGLLAAVIMISSNPNAFERQKERINIYGKNPCSEELFYDTGTQKCNGYIAFNNGGLTGKGLGDSTQKYLYLPEAYSDYIFAIIVEEIGFIGGAFILVLMGVVLWRIFIVAKNASTDYGKVICVGVFSYILLHIAVNLGGIVGLIPLTGVPLPFMSYGGSFTICLTSGLAFVQRVAMETYRDKNKKIKDKSN